MYRRQDKTRQDKTRQHLLCIALNVVYVVYVLVDDDDIHFVYYQLTCHSKGKDNDCRDPRNRASRKVFLNSKFHCFDLFIILPYTFLILKLMRR